MLDLLNIMKYNCNFSWVFFGVRILLVFFNDLLLVLVILASANYQVQTKFMAFA